MVVVIDGVGVGISELVEVSLVKISLVEVSLVEISLVEVSLVEDSLVGFSLLTELVVVGAAVKTNAEAVK